MQKIEKSDSNSRIRRQRRRGIKRRADTEARIALTDVLTAASCSLDPCPLHSPNIAVARIAHAFTFDARIFPTPNLSQSSA